MIFVALTAAAVPDVVSTWDGSSNNWTSNHWSSAAFPNNVDGGPTYDAIISAGSVTLNQDIVIQKLAIRQQHGAHRYSEPQSHGQRAIRLDGRYALWLRPDHNDRERRDAQPGKHHDGDHSGRKTDQ